MRGALSPGARMHAWTHAHVEPSPPPPPPHPRQLNFRWRTCLILRELENEIEALAQGRAHRQRMQARGTREEGGGATPTHACLSPPTHCSHCVRVPLSHLCLQELLSKKDLVGDVFNVTRLARQRLLNAAQQQRKQQEGGGGAASNGASAAASSSSANGSVPTPAVKREHIRQLGEAMGQLLLVMEGLDEEIGKSSSRSSSRGAHPSTTAQARARAHPPA